MEKALLLMDHDRHVYHSLKEGGRSGAAHSQYRHRICDMICVYVPLSAGSYQFFMASYK